MCKGVISILFAIVIAAWPTAIFASPITYSFVPLQSVFFRSGDSVMVAGTVTTDGVIGNFQASDITSWIFSVTVNSVLVATVTSTDPTADLFLGFGSPVATATTLASPFPPAEAQPPIGPKITFWAGATTDRYVLSFHTATANTGSPLFQTEWSNQAILSSDADFSLLISGSTITQPTTPFVFATAVPEPSAVILALLGGLGLLALRLRRQ